MRKRKLNLKEKIRQIKVLRPSRLKCEVHKFQVKKSKRIKAKKG